jgi:hypothetical protein
MYYTCGDIISAMDTILDNKVDVQFLHSIIEGGTDDVLR